VQGKPAVVLEEALSRAIAKQIVSANRISPKPVSDIDVIVS
jgi:hypothetical protein